MKKSFVGAAALFGLCLAPISAQAAWPEDQPITIVVPQQAGGGADVLAREMAMRLQGILGRSVVIEFCDCRIQQMGQSG